MHDYRHYVGKVLDQLKLERVLGVGGSGAVFLARHQIMDTQVAVKILPPHLAVDDMYKERFFREAREVSRMDHPNIVKVSWMGESDGLLFLSMEYMGGGNIGDIVERDGRIPVEEAIRLLVPVAEGLHYAHERGLVHRDIKPDNLLLTAADPPVAKIADFGLVRNLMGGDGQQNITRTGEAIGTPAFMPLEQWDGMEIDRRADLYALGVTFYYCVSGRLPIDEEGISAIVSRLLTGSQTPLTKVCPDADDALWAIIQKSIAPQRNHRMATAQEFADRLRDWLKKRQSAPVAPAAANANVVVPPPPMPVAVPAAVSNAVEEEPGVQTLPRRGRGTIGRQSAGTGSRVPGSSPMVGSGSGHGGGAGVIPPAPVARPSSDARGGGQARTRRAAGTASQSPDDWHDSNNAANAANSGGQRRSPQARSVGTSSQAPDDWNDSGSVPGGMNRHTLEQQKQAAIAASVPGAGAARTREIAKPGARDRGTERPTRGAMAGAGTRRATAPARGSRAARRPSDAGGQATSKVPLIIGGIIVVGLIAVVALVMGASGSPQSSTNTNTDGTNTPGNQTPGNTNATASNGNVPGNTTSNASNGTNSSNASNGNSAVSDVQKLIDRASRVNNPRTAKEMLRDIDDAIAKNPSWKTQLAATRLNLRRMELLPDVNDLRASIGIVGDDPRKASNVLRQLDDFLAANPDVPDLADMFTADRKHLQELAATAETPPDPGPGPGPSGDALPAPDPALKGPHADAVRIEVGKAITFGFKPMQEYWFGFEVTEARMVRITATFDGTTEVRRMGRASFHNADQAPVPSVSAVNPTSRYLQVDAHVGPGRHYMRLFLVAAAGTGKCTVEMTQDAPASAHLGPADAVDIKAGGPEVGVASGAMLCARTRITTGGWYSVDMRLDNVSAAGLVLDAWRVNTTTTGGPDWYTHLIRRGITAAQTRQLLALIPGDYLLFAYPQEIGRPVGIGMKLAAEDLAPRAPTGVAALPAGFSGGPLTTSSRLVAGEYTITRLIEVGGGAVLQIEPGTTLKFAAGTGIACNGELWAEGTAAKPIILKRAAADVAWENLAIANPGSRCILRYVTIQGAGGYGYRVDNGGLVLDRNATVRCGGALLLSSVSGPAILDHCTIEDCSVAGAQVGNQPGGVGGAILAIDCAAELSSTVIRRCKSEGDGGGVYTEGFAVVRMSECELSANEAVGSSGAIALSNNGMAVLTKTRVVDNKAAVRGGGIYLASGDSIVLENCTLSGNESAVGAGMLTASGPCVVVDCTFERNRSSNQAGGLFAASSGSSVVLRTRFTNNEATSLGGGVIVSQGHVTFEGCVFSDNRAPRGSGLYAESDPQSVWFRLPNEDSMRRGTGLNPPDIQVSIR